ncbi:MAG: hypothetical protein ACO1NZ_11910 [Adhaeribacter sp.]
MAKCVLIGVCLLLLATSAQAAVSYRAGLQAPAWQRAQVDTLTIEHDIAHQPFLLDTISPEAIQHLFGAGWVVKKQAVRNRFVKNQTDTLITIRKNKSYICLYAVSQEEKKNFYQSAEIRDPLPIFQQKLHIGQSKKEIQALFPELQAAASIPDLVKIGAGEAGDYLYLFFEKGILRRVAFKPYLD